MDAAAKAAKEQGLNLSGYTGETESATSGTEKLNTGLRTFGGVALAAGAAFGLVSTALEKAGVEDAAEYFSTLSTIFSGLGATLMALPSIITVVETVAVAAGISI
jgi:hypothetical protein